MTRIVHFCLLLCLAIVQPAMAQSSAPRPRGMPSSDGLAMPVWIPKSQSEFDVDATITTLALAEPQIVVAKEAYATYLKKWQETVVAAKPELIHLAAVAAAAHVPMVTVEAPGRLAGLWDREVSLRASLRKLDHQWFNAVESVMAESQRANIQRVRDRRIRTTCLGLNLPIGSANVDLYRLLEETELLPKHAERIDAVLAGYEEAATPLFVALAEDHASLRLPIADASERMRQAENDATAQETAFQGRSELLQRVARRQSAVKKLNDEWLPKFMGALDVAATAFQSAYLRKSYSSEIDPDGLHPKEVHRVLREQEHLSEDQREAIDALWSDFEKQHSILTMAIRSRYDQWVERMAGTMRSEGYDEYRDLMRKLRQDRWELDRRTVTQLANLSPPPPESEPAGWVESFFIIFEKTMETAKADRFPSYL